MKEKLPNVQGVLDWRRTRSCTHNLESHYLILDVDNALISTFEDDEEESPLYINYSSDSHERSDDHDVNNS